MHRFDPITDNFEERRVLWHIENGLLAAVADPSPLRARRCGIPIEQFCAAVGHAGGLSVEPKL